jgi:uncharacterized protein HemX
MANTPNVPKYNKISPKFVLGLAGWAIIATAVIAGAGFYFGYQYKASQDAKTKAAVQDALKAVQAPQVAEASPKN